MPLRAPRQSYTKVSFNSTPARYSSPNSKYSHLHKRDTQATLTTPSAHRLWEKRFSLAVLQVNMPPRDDDDDDGDVVVDDDNDDSINDFADDNVD